MPTKKKAPPLRRAAIIKVIEADANGVGMLYDGSKMCVLGGLLYAAGMPKDRLRYKITPTYVPGARNTLSRVYGITRSHQYNLININDSYESTRSRRRALIKYVKTGVVKLGTL